MRLHYAVPQYMIDAMCEPLTAAAMYSIATPEELAAASLRAQERLQEDEAVAPLAAAYQAVLEAAGRRIAASLRSKAVSLTADSVFLPPDEDEVVDSAKLASEMAEEAAEAQREAARVVVAALDDEGISFDVDTVFTEDLLTAIGERATFAADAELRATYRNTIEVAAEFGWSVPETADALVTKIGDLAPYRAQALARTDLNGLANGGSVHVATVALGKSEQPVYKQWLATDDEVTRESHVDADGQTVPINDTFTVGGTALPYPGFPFGPPEEVINCRCTVTYTSDPAGEGLIRDPDAPQAESDPLAHIKPTEQGKARAEEIWLGRGVQDNADANGLSLAEYRLQLEEKLARELEGVRVKVRTPADVAQQIAVDGRFKTQFETQTSEGVFAPEMRRAAERDMFGLDYLAEPAERPLYGYLDATVERPMASGAYGEVSFVMKPEVTQRSTWTSVDSLNSSLVPSPIGRPSVLSVDPYRVDDPMHHSLSELTTHYLEAQVHGGLSVGDIDRIEVWYEQYGYDGAQTADQGFIARAQTVAAQMRISYPGVTVELREYPPSDYIRGLRESRRASGERGLGLGDDGLGVDVAGGLIPVATSDDAERRQLIADGRYSAVEHAHEGRLETVSTTTGEQHVVRLASDSDDLHAPDDSATGGGSRPSEGLPLANANEEAPMTTTVTEQLADADGEVQMLTPIGWDAVLCVEGEATEDGRLLERGAITWRDLPLTLMGMLETGAWGHEGAKVSGRIDAIDRVMDEMASAGELTSAFGINELAPLIADRTVRGVSVDLAVLDYEYRDRDTGEVLSEDDLFIYWLEGKESQILFTVLDGTIVGATVCPMPAIANAEISLAASAGLSEEGRGILASALEGRRELLGDVPIIRVFTPFDRPAREGLFAAAATEIADPPRSAFELTEFPGNTPFTVTDPDETGWRRVFGHLATWDTCHVGIPGVCTTAPRSSTDPAYGLFHQHQYPLAEGGLIDVGVMMLGTGHASLGASRMEATRHYDKPDMIGAYVRAYDGEHGIWVSGVARDTLTPSGLRELRTNPPSGDWRQYNGYLELIAACAVAVPGFPVVASAEANITASGGHIAIDALIASAGEIVPSAAVKEAMLAAGCACDELATEDEYVDDLVELGVE